MTPTLADVIDTAIGSRMAAMHFSFPGRVEAYDPAQQRASVQPLVLQGYLDEEGERRTERLPVITDVPIMFPRSGPFAMTWPVAVGSLVWVVIASCSIGRWLQGTGGEVDAGIDQRHALADAVAFPCGSSFGAPIAGADTDAMVLHASELRLGSADADAIVARLDELADLVTAYNGHTHLDPVSGTTSTPSVTRPAPTGSPTIKVP